MSVGQDQNGGDNALLLTVGLIVIVVAMANWFIPERLQPTVVKESNSRMVTIQNIAPSRQIRSGPATVTKNGEESTTTRPSSKLTSTRAASSSRRSEALTIALLGIGLICLFAGSPSSRIASVTGPGGIGVTFRGALTSVSDTTALLEQRVRGLETNTEKLGNTVELLVRLISASRED
jgi:hypothetical protein